MGTMKREEIPENMIWDMTVVFENDAAFEKAYENCEKAIPVMKDFQGHLGESAEQLLAFLQKKDELEIQVEHLYFYAHQKLHENLGNAIYQGYAGKTEHLMNQWMVLISFEESELMEAGEEKVRAFLKESKELAMYSHRMEEIFRTKEHILSGEMSELLAMTGEMSGGPSDIFAKFSNVDLKFGNIKDEAGEEVELTHANYIRFLESSNREVRKEAFCRMYETYEKYGNLMASVYNASVKKDSFYAKATKYSSVMEMELDGNEVPLEVYHNLIDSVHKSLPLMHRYVKLRKKRMGYDTLHMYDIYTPILEKKDEKISYEKAKEMVLAALEPMGKEYLGILKEGFDNRWIDVLPNEGKRSGAYSWSTHNCHPYVLLNYQENLDSVFTLAHEMGHAIHSYYSDKNQPYVYSNYVIFVAEVASICNESLLMHYLINNAKTEEEKAFLINDYLEKFRGTLFRQVMFAEFEMLTHEHVEKGETLTLEYLKKTYYDLNQKYYGEDMEEDTLIEMEWARIPHFYTPFYVYQYATGFAAAQALAAGILEEGEKAVERYVQFLKGGCSKSPIELLKIAGVDMSNTEPVEHAMKVMEDLLNQLEKLCG